MPIVVEGTTEVVEMLELTMERTQRICGKALYPGAKIIADACKTKLNQLQTDDSLFRFGKMRQGPTKRQKKALIESMGIAEMRYDNGAYNVKLGFDGYNDIVSEKWPKGQPNAMIARSVNKGTSFMVSQPFMDQTITENEAKVIKAIETEFNNQIEKIWK